MNMGTQYNISELMDNYTDNKFLIEQPQGADTDKVLQGVKEKIRSKKHLRLGTRILIAALAAAAVVITVTATSSPVADYTSALGSEYHFCSDGSASWSTLTAQAPYTVEGDRVIFTADGQHIDITDSIKDDNIYLYEYTGIDSHGLELMCYIGVAGTIGDLSYGEIVFSADLTDCMVDGHNAGDVYYLFDGEEINEKDLTEEQYAVREEHERRSEVKPWWVKFEKLSQELREKYKPNVSYGITITYDC